MFFFFFISFSIFSHIHEYIILIASFLPFFLSFQVSTGAIFQTLSLHKQKIIGLDYSFDGNRLISTSSDGSCILWKTDIAIETFTPSNEKSGAHNAALISSSLGTYSSIQIHSLQMAFRPVCAPNSHVAVLYSSYHTMIWRYSPVSSTSYPVKPLLRSLLTLPSWTNYGDSLSPFSTLSSLSLREKAARAKREEDSAAEESSSEERGQDANIDKFVESGHFDTEFEHYSRKKRHLSTPAPSSSSFPSSMSSIIGSKSPFSFGRSTSSTHFDTKCYETQSKFPPRFSSFQPFISSSPSSSKLKSHVALNLAWATEHRIERERQTLLQIFHNIHQNQELIDIVIQTRTPCSIRNVTWRPDGQIYIVGLESGEALIVSPFHGILGLLPSISAFRKKESKEMTSISESSFSNRGPSPGYGIFSKTATQAKTLSFIEGSEKALASQLNARKEIRSKQEKSNQLKKMKILNIEDIN